LAACWFLPRQFNFPKCSFAQIFHHLEVFQTESPLFSSANYNRTIGKYTVYILKRVLLKERMLYNVHKCSNCNTLM
jgi:hypothetical protein